MACKKPLIRNENTLQFVVRLFLNCQLNKQRQQDMIIGHVSNDISILILIKINSFWIIIFYCNLWTRWIACVQLFRSFEMCVRQRVCVCFVICLLCVYPTLGIMLRNTSSNGYFSVAATASISLQYLGQIGSINSTHSRIWFEVFYFDLFHLKIREFHDRTNKWKEEVDWKIRPNQISRGTNKWHAVGRCTFSTLCLFRL